MSEALHPSLCAEQINGVRLRLGQLTCEQLLELEAEARERIVEAKVDLEILSDYRSRMFPESGG